MNLLNLIKILEESKNKIISIVFPTGAMVPLHFHITEIGFIKKKFIDCGGVHHESSSCLLQVWTANDFEHRMTSDKLLKIIKIASNLFDSYELPVEVEYGKIVVSQYYLSDIEVSEGLLFYLENKKTDCLSYDKCGINEKCCC